MNKRGSVWVWFGVSLLILIVSFVVVYVLSDDKPVVVKQNVSVVNSTVYLLNNYNGKVNFSLSNDTNMLKFGVLFPLVVEKVEPISNGSELVLDVWGEGFYSNRSLCNVTSLNVTCNVSLKVKGVLENFSLSGDRLSVNISGGVLQNLSVCFGWDYNFFDVHMVAESIGKPLGLKSLVDSCYLISDVRGEVVFPIDVTRINLSQGGFVGVWLFDNGRDGEDSLSIWNSKVFI